MSLICPKCNSISIATEKRFDGFTICTNCNYKSKDPSEFVAKRNLSVELQDMFCNSKMIDKILKLIDTLPIVIHEDVINIKCTIKNGIITVEKNEN